MYLQEVVVIFLTQASFCRASRKRGWHGMEPQRVEGWLPLPCLRKRRLFLGGMGVVGGGYWPCEKKRDVFV